MPSLFIIHLHIYYYTEGLHCYFTMVSKIQGPVVQNHSTFTILYAFTKREGLHHEPLYYVVSFLYGPRCAPLLCCVVYLALIGILSTARSTKFRFLAQNLAKFGYAQQSPCGYDKKYPFLCMQFPGLCHFFGLAFRLLPRTTCNF